MNLSRKSRTAMPLYKLTKEAIVPVAGVRFVDTEFKERGDLQRVLREKIDIICPDTLIVAEEFGQWQDSRRRIDLLGIDQEANLVVIELKRTDDGGHMELQAIRYASMISTLPFDRVVEVFGEYLSRLGVAKDPRATILEHLGWESPEDGEFAPSVRIVLASADFSKELTTAVLWLNEQGLNITCVRLILYRLEEDFLVDVQQVIPLPEASEYTVSIRAKRQEARARQEHERDFTKFVLVLGEKEFEPLNKRRSIFEVVRYLVNKGVSPDTIQPILGARVRFREMGENFNADEVANIRRYFRDEDEILHHDGRNYLFSNQWGMQTQQILEALAARFPEHQIKITISE